MSGRISTGTREPRSATLSLVGETKVQRSDTLPRGRQLVTLEDAGDYITKLPKAEHEAAE
jgi:hypothetical protein